MSDGKREEFDPDLWKKFFKTKTLGGFLAIRPWLTAGKLAVDIGELSPTGGLKSNTMVWCPALAIVSFLRCVEAGTATEIYGPTYTYYGGAQTAEGPVSRILKIEPWVAGDVSAYRWKTGIFPATRSESGAYMPDMDHPKSTNMIKVTRAEMTEMLTMISLALQAHAMQDPAWVLHLTGRDRDRRD